jgi:hypothetical protein
MCVCRTMLGNVLLLMYGSPLTRVTQVCPSPHLVKTVFLLFRFSDTGLFFEREKK